MENTRRRVRDLIVAVVTLASFASLVQAQSRTEITTSDTAVRPENLTSSKDGTVYFGSTAKGTIYRAAPGTSRAEPWILASVTDLQLDVIDGLSFLADGVLYANNFTSGKFYRVSVNPDGRAGAVVPIETSIPFVHPDGLRTVGPRTLIQAEGQGRVTELTINGNRAEVRIVQDSLPRATGVTVVGDSAFVLVGMVKAVVVPYRRPTPAH